MGQTGQKILVVDDSSSARKAISSRLREHGYAIVEAASGREALNIIRSSAPFDLITLDLEMDDLDGFDVCRLLRALEDKLKAETPVVFLPGNDTLENRKKGLAIGAADFLVKSRVMEEIHHKVSRILFPDQALDGLRALVVDDSRVYRFIIRSALQEHSVRVLEAIDGTTALAALQHDEPYDLVITDQNMPGDLDGTGLTREIRKLPGMADVPVILVSSNINDSGILEFFAAGGTDSLRKPFIKEELLARLKIHLQDKLRRRQVGEYMSRLEEMVKAKDRVLSACSHDLKSPLTSINGFVRLALKDNQDSRMAHLLSRIEEAGLMLGKVVDDILESSRQLDDGRSKEMNPLDLRETVQRAVEMNHGVARVKQITLDQSCPAEPVMVEGNELALTRVLNNLLSNALKFTPRDGHIRIRLTTGAGQVRMTVEDDGVGLDEETRHHLFERFSRASRKGIEGEDGTGLGLSISSDIITLHGGTITVDNPERGTRFVVDLPCLNSPAKKAANG